MASMMSARAACGTAEYWTGTTEADIKYDTQDGVDEDNHWFFLEGGDFGRTLACNDPEVYGDVGRDDIGGGSGSDTLYGGKNDDKVYGGQGSDSLSGDELAAGSGNDTISDKEGPSTGAPSDTDFAWGGGGGDTIDVQDGDTYDSANGEGGTDTCRVDHSSERGNGCEN